MLRHHPLLLLLLLLILLSLIPTPTTSSSHCPHPASEEIQKCVQPVAEYAKALNKQEGSGTANSSTSSPHEFGQAIQLPRLGRQVFKELCGLIRGFETCVADYREQCSRHITINLIEASYGYLCNEGYETFMNSAECLMELDQRPSVKKCHDDTLREIEHTNGDVGISMVAKLDRMCDALNFFSGCVRRPIRHNCGVEAWQVIFRVLKDTTKTLMPACEFSGRAAHPRVEHSSEGEDGVSKTTRTMLRLSATTTSPSPPVRKHTPDWLIPKVTMQSRRGSMEEMVAVVEEQQQQDDDDDAQEDEQFPLRPYEVDISGGGSQYGERRKFAQAGYRKGGPSPNGSTTPHEYNRWMLIMASAAALLLLCAV